MTIHFPLPGNRELHLHRGILRRPLDAIRHAFGQQPVVGSQWALRHPHRFFQVVDRGAAPNPRVGANQAAKTRDTSMTPAVDPTISHVQTPQVQKKYPPYRPAKHGAGNLLNSVARFSAGTYAGHKIECRHIGLFWIQQRITAYTSGAKFDYAPFQTANALANAMSPNMEDQFQRAMISGPHTYIRHVDEFGAFLDAQFGMMKAANENAKWMMIQSHRHLMALELKIHRPPQEPSTGTPPAARYSFNFYDPNTTNSHMHGMTGDREEIKASTMQMVLSKDDMQKHFPEGSQRFLAVPVATATDNKFDYLPGSAAPAGGRICDLRDDLDCTTVYMYYRDRYDGNLANLADYARQKNLDRLATLALFRAVDSTGMSGPHIAVASGNDREFKAAFQSLMKLAGLAPGSSPACGITRRDVIEWLSMSVQTHGPLIRHAVAWGQPRMIRMIEECLDDIDASPDEWNAVIKPDVLLPWVTENERMLPTRSVTEYRNLAASLVSGSEHDSHGSEQTVSDV
jgi:hypothetical protein